MRKELEILQLAGYLSEEGVKQGFFNYGTTFSRLLPATSELPAITVGLGVIRDITPKTTKMELMPTIKNTPNVMLNTFINEVAEQYLRCSEILPEQWQELLLLNLGYAKTMKLGSQVENAQMFEAIPSEERLPLLKKHGFHKVATFVAHGHTEDIDTIINTLDELNKGNEPISYGVLMDLLELGVPAEDLQLAAQLPPEMVEGLYGDS